MNAKPLLLLVSLLLFSLTGCFVFEDDDDEPDPCDEEGAAECSGESLKVCTRTNRGLEWQHWRNCSQEGLVCVSLSESDAACLDNN